MPRTSGYVKRDTRNGEFSPRIKPAVNVKLDIYCKVNGLNKTKVVNEIVDAWLEEKFERLNESEPRQRSLGI